MSTIVPRLAAIIDDAFDTPTTTSFLRNELPDFWARIESDETAWAEWERLFPDINTGAHVTDATIEQLWQLYSTQRLVALQNHGRLLFAEKERDLQHAQTIAAALTACGYNVSRFGSAGNVPTNQSYDLILLDFILEQNPHVPEQRATEVARRLVSQPSGGSKPFIALMSNRADIHTFKDLLRAQAGIVGIRFGCISKEIASDRSQLALQVASWGIGSHVHASIEEFADTIIATLPDMRDTMAEMLRSIEPHDYGFIHLASLRSEGQPLGDYILWLLTAALTHRIRVDPRIREAQRKLDVCQTDDWPAGTEPTTALARIYSQAITEPVPSVLAHPLHRGADPGPPLLASGDVFISHDQQTAYVVANAPCSLMFTPGGKRQADLKRSIYLVPGSLVTPAPEHGVEWITIADQPRTIAWQYDHMVAVPLGSFSEFATTNTLTRQFRLSPTHAAEIQSNAAEQLAGVGLPVAPPTRESRDVRILVRSNSTAFTTHGGPISKGAVLVHQRGERNKGTIHLTLNTIRTLLQDWPSIRLALEAATPQKTVDPHSEAQIQSYRDRISRIEETLARPQDLIQHYCSKGIPKAGNLSSGDVFGIECAMPKSVLSSIKPLLLLVAEAGPDKVVRVPINPVS